MKTIIVGLGNPLLRDDRVGLVIAEQLADTLADEPNIDVVTDFYGGLRLMENMIGYDRAIIIDAILSGSSPGTVHKLPADSISSERGASQHDANLTTALEVGRHAGAQLPANTEIMFIAIEAEDVSTFDEECTVHVKAAIPEAIDTILAELQHRSLLPD